ncbi:glycosyltransferase [Bacillus infantis]|uniref:glycosyltransferase family 32 protein n=1 Tax=Bacillus infantis TaxID=324767 RepID=UPI00344CFF93
MSVIPKVIHYCWFGGNPLPDLAKKCIESWGKYCPDFEIRQWDESNFDINCNQYVKEAYDSQKWAFVSDYVRLKIVYEYGGIYLDTDVELIKSLDDLIEYEGFMGFENSVHINTGLGFGAKKYNRIIKAMLDDYNDISFIKKDGTFDLTPCPIRNTNTLIKTGLLSNGTKQIIDNIVFLPREYMCPINYETGKMRITDITYSIHHFDESWHTESEKQWQSKKRKYKNVFGKKIGTYLYLIDKSLKVNGYVQTFKKGINKLLKI